MLRYGQLHGGSGFDPVERDLYLEEWYARNDCKSGLARWGLNSRKFCNPTVS